MLPRSAAQYGFRPIFVTRRAPRGARHFFFAEKETIVDSNGPSGVSLIAALAIAGVANFVKTPPAPTKPVPAIVVSVAPAPAPSAPLAKASPAAGPTDLRLPDLALELRELRKMLQTCSFPKTADDGKVTLCGRCFFCTFRRIATAR